MLLFANITGVLLLRGVSSGIMLMKISPTFWWCKFHSKGVDPIVCIANANGLCYLRVKFDETLLIIKSMRRRVIGKQERTKF